MSSHLTNLQQFLVTYYDAEELRQLALELGLNYDDLGGDGRISSRAMGLVMAIGRQKRWPNLLAALHQGRPHPFEQDQLSQEPDFIEKLADEFDNFKQRQPDSEPVTIQQEAGSRAVQVGQNFGQIIVHNMPGSFGFVILFLGLLLIILLGFVWFQFLRPANSVEGDGALSSSSTTAPPTPRWQPLQSRRLEPVVLPSLAESHLQAVAADGGLVWFGAEEGLYVFQEGDTDARRVVDGAVTAVAAAPAAGVWFGVTSSEGTQLGLYQLDTNQVTSLTTQFPLTADAFITDIAANGDGLVWLGDSMGHIYRYDIDSGSGVRLPDPPSLPVENVYSLAVEPSVPETLWVVGSSAIYRWQGDQWATEMSGSEIASGVINAVATGDDQRAWFGHADGLSFLQDQLGSDVRQECSLPSLPSPLVTDLVSSNEGQDLWLVSRGGLAWIDARPEASPPGNCDIWQVQAWTEDSFWQPTTAPGTFRLAIDDSIGQEPIIWVVRQGTGRVRWLPIDE